MTRFESTGVSSVAVATGSGGGHIYHLHFEPGGSIGRHRAGPAQLFFIARGSGWVEGEDRVRREIQAGEAAYITAGESHAKGSEDGMSALMIQFDQMDIVAAEVSDHASIQAPQPNQR